MLRLPKFIKRYIRRTTQPVTQADALSTRKKLSIAYAFFAWHACGVAAYLAYRAQTEQKQLSGLSDGRYFADVLKKDNVQLVRVRNTEVVGRWDLEEEKKHHGRLLTTEEVDRQLLPQQGPQADLDQLV